MRNVNSNKRKRVFCLIPNSDLSPAFTSADARSEREFRIPHSKGFTLIELTVVIVILGVMLTLIIPRLADLGEANLKRSARHLTGMIRFLRDEAQAKKNVYRLRFDIPAGHYWAEVRIETPEHALEFIRWESAMGTVADLSGSTSFRDVRVNSHPDEPYIEFAPNGWVESAFIHLRDGSERDFTLRVKPLTGDTELLDGYVEEK